MSNCLRLAVWLAVAVGPVLAPGRAAAQLNVVINPGAGLSANAAALAAFDRAALQWSSRFSDPITVTINANLANLGNPNVIGQASSVAVQFGFDTVRNAMVADAAGQPDNGIVAFLPTAAQFTANTGTATLGGNITINKANAKALGFGGLDAQFGASDGSITFNSTFSFDFDNSNGVSVGQMDFETVASHEIAHVLGFTSRVDFLDQGGTTINPTPLDLFRFSASDLPTTDTEFTTKARELRPGVAAAFSDTADNFAFSTGVINGDGRQASHWKADELTGTFIGIMDPTLSFGQFYLPTEADYRAFDLIGYNLVPVQEPTGLLLAGAIGLGAAGIRSRRKWTAGTSDAIIATAIVSR